METAKNILIVLLAISVAIIILGTRPLQEGIEEKIELGPLYGDLICNCRIHYRGDSAIYVDKSGYIKLIRYEDHSKKFE